MKQTVIYTILLFALLEMGCNKIELDPVDGAPVFMANIDFDSSPLDLKAGIDGFYMFSSFEKDAHDVHIFSGEFAKKDSLDGQELLAIHIRDFQQLGQGSPNISQAINKDRTYLFSSDKTDTVWSITLDTIGWGVDFDANQSILPPTPVQYEWQFSNFAAISDTVGFTNFVFPVFPQNSPVQMTVSAINNSCSSFLSKPVAADAVTPTCDLNMDVVFNPSSFNPSLSITAVPTGTLPFSFQWSSGSSSGPNYFIDSLIPGQLSAYVTVTDGTGCSTSGGISTIWSPGTVPNICVAKFNQSSPTPIVDSLFLPVGSSGDSLQFSGVTIEYNTKNGMHFSSNRNSQAPSAFVKVIAVEDYEENELGQKTKKVTLEFRCRLWDIHGDYRDVKSGKAVIAVAFP